MSKTPKPKRQGKKITSVLVNVKEHELVELINALSDNIINLKSELKFYTEDQDKEMFVKIQEKIKTTEGLYSRAKKLQEKFK